MKNIFLLLLIVSPIFSQQIIGRKPMLGEQINWSHPLVDGLEARWLINEGSGLQIFDVLRGDVSGTLASMTNSDWIPGRDGWALNFDNTNNVVRFGDNFDIGTGDFSYAIWFKTEFGANEFHSLVAKSRLGADIHRYFTIIDGGNISTFSTYTGGSGSEVSVSENPYIDGNWHFLVVVFDRNKHVEMFLDGVSQGTDTDFASASAEDINSVFHLGIGGYNDVVGDNFSTAFFKGGLSDFGIWRKALSVDNISQLYQDGYAMFEQPLYGRRLAIAAAAAAGTRSRFIFIN